MYTLYTMPGSCSTGIHTLLNALNQPVEIIHRDDVKDYQSIVPTNQVPALKDGDVLLSEGAAIAQYLLKKHQDTAESLLGTTEFNYWLMFCYATLHPAYSKMFTVWKSMEDGESKDNFYNTLADNISHLWTIVDKQLEGKAYLVGDKASVVDYLISIYANWGNFFPQLSIKLGDNVVRVIKNVAELPEFKNAFEKEGANHAIPANSY